MDAAKLEEKRAKARDRKRQSRANHKAAEGIRKRIKRFRANQTEEQANAGKKQKKAAMSRFRANQTEEQTNAGKEKKKAGMSRFRANQTDEQTNAGKKQQKAAMSRFRANQTDEQTNAVKKQKKAAMSRFQRDYRFRFHTDYKARRFRPFGTELYVFYRTMCVCR